MRLTKEELDKIKKEYNVDQLWSWSRVSSWKNGHYNWYLHYLKKEEPDRTDCIYGDAGNFAHDILEKLYSGELKYEQMLSEFEDGWSVTRDILGLKFDRNDSEKDLILAKRYYENLHHFFNQHHKMIDNPVVCEDFALIKINNNILQGYIDAYYKDKDGNINICDWKTSSIYTGDNLIEKSGQLVSYGISFVQKGIPIEKIKLKFNFLKYATITYEQKNGKIKSSNVERRLLGEKLQTPSKIWLKTFGHEVDDYLKKLIDTNGDISVLPTEVQDKIEVGDCWVEVPFNNNQIDYWTEKVDKTIREIESTISIFELLKDESIFYDSIEDIKKESYYYAVLSEYSANKNICYKRYLDSLEEVSDLFS